MYIKILTSLCVIACSITRAQTISAIPTTVTVSSPPAHKTKLTVIPTLSIGGRASDVTQIETTPGLVATGVTSGVVPEVQVAAPIVAERLITTEPVVRQAPVIPSTVSVTKAITPGTVLPGAISRDLEPTEIAAPGSAVNVTMGSQIVTAPAGKPVSRMRQPTTEAAVVSATVPAQVSLHQETRGITPGSVNPIP